MAEKTDRALAPGDVVAVLAMHKAGGQRYLFYGEVVEAREGFLQIATAAKYDGKNVSPKQQSFDAETWDVSGVVCFASWDRSVLFDGGVHEKGHDIEGGSGDDVGAE